jgi:hypothetical protein
VNCAGNIIPGSMGYKEMPKVAQLNLVSAQMCSELLAPELAKSEVSPFLSSLCFVQISVSCFMFLIPIPFFRDIRQRERGPLFVVLPEDLGRGTVGLDSST